MGFKRFTEIEAWQLSMKLLAELDAVLERSTDVAYRSFCHETRNAIESVPRNIAEGFGRYTRRDFARFVAIAKASLLETQTNLIIARSRKLVTEQEFEQLWELSEHTVAKTTALLTSLRGATRRDPPGSA
jgi:four helix bundle protein